ncbi:hypothetical protein ACJZ2D_015927 [Fusarium nematophilum]
MAGNMGSAILSGLLDATRSQPHPRISRFIVVTKSVESADRLRGRFEQDKSRLLVRHGASVWAMQQADIILLGCKPHMAEHVLGEGGVREALSGKFLISVLAGKTPQVLESYIHQNLDRAQGPYVVRAMPNVAARIGKVKVLATDVFDIGSLLVGSSMAILSVGLDGILDGCVLEGIRRPEALEMAAQSMLGMAELLRQGEQPAAYRESVSSPRGGTIAAILTVEKAGMRGTFAQSIIDGTKRIQL